MSFQNACVEIRLGNVESRIVGPTPRQRLDAVLNPHAQHAGADDLQTRRVPLVYNPVGDLFLTGALGRVTRVLRDAGVRYRIRDARRRAARTGDWRLRGVALRDYQREVVTRAVAAGRGLIDVGTGGGKTLLAAAIVAELGLPTLWLVTTRVLLEQTRRHLTDCLGEEPGIVGDGIRRPARLTVALIQGLDAAGFDPAPWSAGTLVFDEGHHAAAGTYQELIRRVAPRHSYFLSAVPFRPGADQAVLDALAGEPLTGGRYSARFLIEHGYACPVMVRLERCRIRGEMGEQPFASLYRRFLVENPERNARIAEIAAAEIAAGRSTLVMADRVDHGDELRRRIGPDALFVHGATPGHALRSATAAFAGGALRCLVATSALFQEGVSICGIQTLIAAGGLKSRARVIQMVGRGMRRAPGKSACVYVDFWDDDDAGILRAHSARRIAALKAMGFHVPPVESARTSWSTANIRPHWSQVAGSRTFRKVDGCGRILGEALCLCAALVPDKFCRKCVENNACERGGRILWQTDPD